MAAARAAHSPPSPLPHPTVRLPSPSSVGRAATSRTNGPGVVTLFDQLVASLERKDRRRWRPTRRRTGGATVAAKFDSSQHRHSRPSVICSPARLQRISHASPGAPSVLALCSSMRNRFSDANLTSLSSRQSFIRALARHFRFNSPFLRQHSLGPDRVPILSCTKPVCLGPREPCARLAAGRRATLA